MLYFSNLSIEVCNFLLMQLKSISVLCKGNGVEIGEMSHFMSGKGPKKSNYYPSKMKHEGLLLDIYMIGRAL